MDEAPNTLLIKITDYSTGEIIEKEVKNSYEAEQLYIRVKAIETAAKKAKDMLMKYLDEWLGQDKEYAFPDGHRLVRQDGRETRTWTAEGLRAVGLDEDAVAVVSKIDMTLAKQLVDEHIEAGTIKPNAKKELNVSADVKVTKPSITMK